MSEQSEPQISEAERARRAIERAIQTAAGDRVVRVLAERDLDRTLVALRSLARSRETDQAITKLLAAQRILCPPSVKASWRDRLRTLSAWLPRKN